MGTVQAIFAEERLWRSYRKWYRAHAWPEVTRSDRKWPCSEVCYACTCTTESCAIFALVGPFSPELTNSRDRKRPYPALLFVFVLFFPYFFYCTLFPVFFSCTILSYFFSRTSPPPRTFFPVLFFPALSSRTFSKVATFEIERFKISVSCFSSTCRYNAVHVPCGISIQTSPVGLPLDGWGARMRDLKGPKMNLFNLKEDWNVL